MYMKHIINGRYDDDDELMMTNETPSQNYWMSLAIWDHSVLPATQHSEHTPPKPQPDRPVLDLPTLEGCKAELT